MPYWRVIGRHYFPADAVAPRTRPDAFTDRKKEHGKERAGLFLREGAEKVTAVDSVREPVRLLEAYAEERTGAAGSTPRPSLRPRRSDVRRFRFPGDHRPGARGCYQRMIGLKLNEDIARVDRILGAGCISLEKARRVREEEPEFSAGIVRTLELLKEAEEYTLFSRFANLAVWLAPDGLSDVLIQVLQERPRGIIEEDLVDILGQLQSESAVPAIRGLLDSKRGQDSPYYSLAEKCIQALGEIGSVEGEEVLREVATGEHSNALRWHAAVELGIEDELGFDEDEMLRYP